MDEGCVILANPASHLYLMCSNLPSLFLSGTAGCVATLLHDAVMNPAEGKRVKPNSRIMFLCYTQEVILGNVQVPRVCM